MYPGRARLPENTIKQSFKQVWESRPLGKGLFCGFCLSAFDFLYFVLFTTYFDYLVSQKTDQNADDLF